MENGVINNKFNKLSRKKIMRGLSKADIEKLICYKTTQEIWDKLQSIYEVDMQVACEVKRISLEDDAVKDLKSIEYHETNDDSSVSRGQINDQHAEEMQIASKLLFCCYCRTIGHLFSNCSTANTSESESCSSNFSGERTTLILIQDLENGQEENGSTSSEEEEITSQVSVKESLESSREQSLESEKNTSGESSDSIELQDLEEN